MAHPQVVITQASANTPAVGGLFEGVSFFLLQRLPLRSSFIERIQANGGRVVRQESQADHIIADHYRHDCPAGSISYTFIETAIRTGILPDPKDHTAGRRQGAAREAGSGAPGKGTRTPFTPEDDRVLWQWVKQSGGLEKGNEIYKQLESQNSRHTWQAWRDRYVKRLIDRPPAGVEVTVAANPPPSPPTAQDEQEEIAAQVDEVQEEAEVEEEEEEVAEVEGDFTEDELQLLLDQADDIELIPEDREDEAWSAWAQAYPQHSAQSWRNFWKEEGQSAYQKRKRAKELAEEEEWRAMQANSEEGPVDLDGVNKRRSLGRASESPDPISSSSQKRKRPAFVSVAERMYGKKKRKSNNDEIFGREDSDDELAAATEVAEQTMATSELNRQAGAQLQHESQEDAESALPAEDAVQDAHAEAQAKFDEEVLGVVRKPVPIATHFMSNLPTSDINRAADQQLLRESLERDEADVDESSLLQTPSVQSQDEDEDEAGSVRSQEADNALEAVLDAPGDRLTEANLASQQAEHKAQLLRGADLPEDNDAQDSEQQSEYVRYLQSLTGRSNGMQSMPAITFETQKSIAIESQMPLNEFPPTVDALDTNAFGELPHSSQQEIDGVLDDMIQWPDSPVTAQRRDPPQSQSQSIRPATGVSYPQLPARPFNHSQRDEEVFSSQLSMIPEVSYPSLRESQAGSILSAQPGRSQQQQLAYEHSSSSTSEESVSSQQDPGEEDDIDLSMVAPVGGWSSSPAKAQSSQATPVALRQQVRVKQERQLFAQSQSPSQAVGTQEVVELSSTSSSSSSSDESEELPADPTRTARAPQHKALETQDILNAETQQPDLFLPLPPESDDDNTDRSSDRSNPSSPVRANTTESQRQLADTQRLEDDDVNTYITTMVVRGYKEASVIAALKCTSMRPDLVELVLQSERAGMGLPNDVPGIWSEEEDKVLESGNSKGLRRLEEKHSWKEAEERMTFLVDYREESEGDEGVE